MNKNQYILLSADVAKSISAAEALQFFTASSRSRYINRHLRLNKCLRERMTAFIGILFLSGIPFKVDALPVTEGLWLLTITVKDNSDAGTPSATTPHLSPTPPSRRTSGRDRNRIPPHHIQTFYNSYLLARWNRASPVLLALPGARI